MTEPLTIYECSGPLAHRSSVRRPGGGIKADRCFFCPEVVQEVRVFREEDVRPLWEVLAFGAGLRGDDPPADAVEAMRAFPAPEEWTA